MQTVHIVLAAYNAEKYLREQLNSILTGYYKDITIEICDDASADGTVQIAKEYVSKYPGIVFLHENKSNIGYRHNFLEGIKRSKSPYIMLCDQDDIWLKHKIRNTLDKMREVEANAAGRPVLIFTDAILYDGEKKKKTGSFHKSSHLDVSKVDISHLLMENKAIGCTVMINKYILPFLEILPDEIRVHDWWLALICSAFGKIGYLESKTLLYRQHCDNIIGSASFFKYVKHRTAMLKEQRDILDLTYKQAAVFYKLFASQMTSGTRNKVKQFAMIPEMGFLKRRTCCLRNGYLKSGLTRNTALMLIL